MSVPQPSKHRLLPASRRVVAGLAIAGLAAVTATYVVIDHRSSRNSHTASTAHKMIGPGSPSPSYSADKKTPSHPMFATLGLGVPGGDPKNLQIAEDSGVQARWVRLYTNAIPASIDDWADAKAAQRMGYRLWLSITPRPDELAAGGYDAALTQFVKTLPEGTRLTTNHEPSNKSKGITPAAFAAGWNHGAKVILDASGGAVLPWAVEVQANVIKEHYLDHLDPALVNRGGIGLDGYDGIRGASTAVKSFEQVAGDSFAFTKQLFPDARVGFAEFNSSRTDGWAQWVADALAWCASVHASVAVLFTSLGEWRKTPAELRELAQILNPS